MEVYRLFIIPRWKKNACDSIHKHFLVVLTDKATGNITLVSRGFYVSAMLQK